MTRKAVVEHDARAHTAAGRGRLTAVCARRQRVGESAVTDAEIGVTDAVARAKDGDRDALQVLYMLYARDVRRFVTTIVRDPHDAEDITHTVFAKLVHAIEKYEPREGPFASWINRVARNAALDHLRAQRQIPVEGLRPVGEADESANLDRAASLKSALLRLPEDQREVVVLRHVAGLSPPEIAERLGKSQGSVHGLHHRGRSALRAALVDLGAAPSTAAA